jgi:hypothetical protein
VIAAEKLPELLRFLPEPFRAAAVLAFAFGVAPARLARLNAGAVESNGLRVDDRLIAMNDIARFRDAEVDPAAWLAAQRAVADADAPLFYRLQPPAAASLRLRLALKEAARLQRSAAISGTATAPADLTLPGFLTIGVPRSATTWLHEALSRHPGIHLGHNKEPEFFTDHRFHAGVRAYAEHFAAAKPGQLVGDISVGYLHSPRAPDRIAATLPDCRFIVMLRDPLKRARSYYEYRLANAIAPASFEDSLKWPEFRDILIEQGKYDLDLDRWFARFPVSRFFFILHEDIYDDAGGTLERLYDFLGVERIRLNGLDRPVNTRSHVRWPAGYQHLRRSELVLSAALGPAALPLVAASKFIRGNMLSDTAADCISEPTRKTLQAEFRPHTERLQGMIGRDLSRWLQH